MSGRRHRKLAGTVVLAVVSGWSGVAAVEPGDGSPPDGFAAYLAGLRQEALTRRISVETLDAALGGVKHVARVIELDRRQPEFSQPLDRYLTRYVSQQRVKQGRQALARHRALLRRIADRYGVQPRFVVALWGVESSYGANSGSFNVIDALATLAFDGRRSKFFRDELFHALRILEAGDIQPRRMLGSWAGAMGQPQFMPSSYSSYAVDFDGDQRRDIWRTTADVLASTANYLARFGWNDDQTWGRRIRLPADFDQKQIGLETRKTLPEWQSLGVRRANGDGLPRRPLPASIVRPDPKGAAYLVYDNYRTLLRWNRSEYFGIAVGRLSDRIQAR